LETIFSSLNEFDQTHRAPVIFQFPASPFKKWLQFCERTSPEDDFTGVQEHTVIASSYLTWPHRASLVHQSHLNYIYAAPNVLGYFRENVP
jgi:hypothetical protein